MIFLKTSNKHWYIEQSGSNYTRTEFIVVNLKSRCFTLDKHTDSGSCLLASSHVIKIEKSSPVTGSLASSVVLPCRFSMITASPSTSTHTAPAPGDDLRIKWTKLARDGDKMVLVAHNGVVKVGQDYESRVSVFSHSLSAGDASLTISQVRTSDMGLYRCELMIGMEDSQGTVSLDVPGEWNKHILTAHLSPLEVKWKVNIKVLQFVQWLNSTRRCYFTFVNTEAIITNSAALEKVFSDSRQCQRQRICDEPTEPNTIPA